MCHQSVLSLFTQVLAAADFHGKHVLEVGSYNVNGSVRPLVEQHQPASYLGVDASSGPGVDKVVQCGQLVDEFGADSFDVVVTTEMLEHVEDWQDCLHNLVRVVRPGGLLVVTTRSAGFPYHPYPDDFWRYSLEAFGQILAAVRFETLLLMPDPQDPGIFVKARKPANWEWPSGTPALVWANVEITTP